VLAFAYAGTAGRILEPQPIDAAER
jgi:hypothetical protein